MLDLTTIRNISKGIPCGSGIEKFLKHTLLHLHSRNVLVHFVWVRGHIGIEGNEKAGQAVGTHSWEGDIRCLSQTSTHAGVWKAGGATREEWRTEPSYLNKSHQNYQALSALRTNRDPQNSWLHKLGKADPPACPCGHPDASGDHITFHCPTWATQRHNLIGYRSSWPELDNSIWVKTGPDKEDIIDGGQEWFGHNFGVLA